MEAATFPQTCLGWVLLLWVAASIVCLDMAVPDISTDRDALLALKARITSDPYEVLANWSPEVSICNWTGIVCGRRHGRVASLNLANASLRGTIPPQIGNLTFLYSLSLRNSSFHGALPAQLSRLRRLRLLNLGYNMLSGKIPSSIFNLTELQVLSLRSNRFSGRLERGIGNLTMLEEMGLAYNVFSGAIPPEIGDLVNLRRLSLPANNFAGQIPSSIFNISNLEYLLMSSNLFSGSLPSSIGMFLPNLEILSLGQNNLSGTISSTISNASKLSFIDLSYNLFTGSIPNTLGNLIGLEALYLSFNNLRSESSTAESSFLSSLLNCKRLRSLDLTGNSLKGLLLSSVGKLSTSLEQFRAGSCNINGNIGRGIGNLINLIAIDLGHNELTGTIPTTLGQLTKLQGLSLQGNRLSGTIPNDLCNLTSLGKLSLGGNNLVGSVPGCFGDLTVLQNLDLSSNNLSSTLPLSLWTLRDILFINMSSNSLNGDLSYISNFMVAERIDFSRNQFLGKIPAGIGVLTTLAFLSLSYNGLHGPIPESIGDSLGLDSLDLSHNQLSGVIPKSLENLKFLEYFDVSFNNLEGEIPSGGPFNNFSALSYIGNRGLCGESRLNVPQCTYHAIRNTVSPIDVLNVVMPLLAALVIVSSIFMWVKWKKLSRPSSFSAHPELVEATEGNRKYTYRELLQATNGFSPTNLIGSGGYGKVYKGTLKDGLVVAVKVYDVEDERSSMSFDIECEVMRKAEHPNIMRMLCSSSSAIFKAVVIEYMVNGSLEKWLHTYNYRLDIQQRVAIMMDTALAIRHLHDACPKTIIHCDLNPSNILLDEDMVARISDFGLAKILDSNKPHFIGRSTLVGTLGYAAPEYGLYGDISNNTDVFCFGIMLMETFTGKKPTDEMFTGDMSLRRWVMESLPQKAIAGINRNAAEEIFTRDMMLRNWDADSEPDETFAEVIDPGLLQMEDEHYKAKMLCVAHILRLGVICSADSPLDRLDMLQVATALNRIKHEFLDCISNV